MSNDKTNYRNVYKSDHLGVVDIEELKDKGHNLIFKIKEVKQLFKVQVAGKKIDANVCYFEEPGIKPWVINAGNAGILRKFSGSIYVQDWGGLMIQLYINPNVENKGVVTGGIRIMPNMPASKKELVPSMKNAWDNAKAAYVRDGNLDAVTSRMDISSENIAAIIKEASENVD